MQSTYAIGEAIAALVVAVVLPSFGWRAVFFVGVLPALLVFWIRRRVPEPHIWKERARDQVQRRFEAVARIKCSPRRNARHSHERLRDVRLLGPVHLDSGLPVAPGLARWARLGAGEDHHVFSGAVFRQVAGVALFGFFADAFGRRKPYFLYLLIAAALVPRIRLYEESILASAAWSFSGVFWNWIFFRLRRYRQ